MSDDLVRLNFERGDSAAVVLHDPQTDLVIFTEQFRYPTHAKGPGWLLEIPAGTVDDDDEDDPIRTMRREVMEEIGYRVDKLKYICKFYVTPGDLGWQAVDGRDAKVGMLVCWDQWYPEAARLTALQGAEILFYPTAIGWWHGETPADRRQQREAWQLMHRAHAIANGIWVAAVNRVGREDDLEFWGGSMLIDPGGQVVCEGSQDREEVLVAEVDPGRIEELRRGWPFLRDRRIDAYGGLMDRYGDLR